MSEDLYSDTSLIDERVPRGLPYPIAVTWHAVGLATTAADRRDRLLAVFDALMRTVGAVVLADYARGPRDAEVDHQIERLRRPSLGDWKWLLQTGLAHLRARPAPAAFLPEAARWLAPGSAEEHLLSELLRVRNECAHGKTSGAPGEETARATARELAGLLRALFGTLGWLADCRLVRVIDQDPTARGTARGRLQVFRGRDATPPLLPAEWNAEPALLTGRVYLLAPRGDRALDLHPLVQVRPQTADRQERPFLFAECWRKKDGYLLRHDGNGAQEHVPPGADLPPFSAWTQGSAPPRVHAVRDCGARAGAADERPPANGANARRRSDVRGTDPDTPRWVRTERPAIPERAAPGSGTPAPAPRWIRALALLVLLTVGGGLAGALLLANPHAPPRTEAPAPARTTLRPETARAVGAARPTTARPELARLVEQGAERRVPAAPTSTDAAPGAATAAPDAVEDAPLNPVAAGASFGFRHCGSDEECGGERQCLHGWCLGWQWQAALSAYEANLRAYYERRSEDYLAGWAERFDCFHGHTNRTRAQLWERMRKRFAQGARSFPRVIKRTYVPVEEGIGRVAFFAWSEIPYSRAVVMALRDERWVITSRATTKHHECYGWPYEQVGLP